MTDSRETVYRRRQAQAKGAPTHCRAPADPQHPTRICAAYVPAGSHHPGLCDDHANRLSATESS